MVCRKTALQEFLNIFISFFHARLEAAAAGRLQRLESRLLAEAPSHPSLHQKQLTFSGWRAEVATGCASCLLSACTNMTTQSLAGESDRRLIGHPIVSVPGGLEGRVVQKSGLGSGSTQMGSLAPPSRPLITSKEMSLSAGRAGITLPCAVG